MIHKIIGAIVIIVVTALLFAAPIAILYTLAIKAPIVFILTMIVGVIAGIIFYREAD